MKQRDDFTSSRTMTVAELAEPKSSTDHDL
jgi:hypothetical protein